MTPKLMSVEDWIAEPDIIKCGSSRHRTEVFKHVVSQWNFTPAYAVGNLSFNAMAEKARPLRLESDKGSTSPIYRWLKANCSNAYSVKLINNVVMFKEFNDALAFYLTWC